MSKKQLAAALAFLAAGTAASVWLFRKARQWTLEYPPVRAAAEDPTDDGGIGPDMVERETGERLI